jgi:aspartyl/asparaginyl beta-hydroxylase (cupin superfamily)
MSTELNKKLSDSIEKMDCHLKEINRLMQFCKSLPIDSTMDAQESVKNLARVEHALRSIRTARKAMRARNTIIVV